MPTKKELSTESFRRKRRNIVRDWLYYVVWYVRLKRILEHHKTQSLPSTPTSLFFGQSIKNSE